MTLEIKLKYLAELIKKQSISMFPSISITVVHEFERKHGVSLPGEYVAFITTIGNGGTLPIHPDSYGNLMPIEQCHLERVSEPFAHAETMLWNNIDSNVSKNEKNKVENGHFAFMECADGFTWDLIVTGKRRGEVWLFGADGMMRGKELGFLEWVKLYIECKLTERMKPNAEEDFYTYTLRIQKKIKRRKMIMNPPISLSEVQKIEETHLLQLPEDYISFVTTIGDGCKKMPINNLGQPWRELHSIWDCDFEKATKPFPLTEPWRFAWYGSDKINDYDIANDPEGKWEAVQNGRFCFIELDTEPFTCSYSLILSGPSQGQVWAIDRQRVDRLGTHTFTSWFEFYLDGND